MKTDLCSKLGLTVLVCLTAWTSVAQLSAPATAGASAVPNLINYDGVLKGTDGRAITAVTGVTFLLYRAEQGGAPLWLETQNVTPDKTGRYTVQLGANTAKGLPSDLFVNGEARWLAVQIASQAEQARVLLVAVPYAMKAVDAQTLGGLPASAFLLAAPTSSSTAASTTTGAAGVASSSAGPPTTSNVTTTGGLVNTLPLWTTATNVQSSVVTQTGSGSTAKIGINTATPAVTLDVKGAETVRGTLTLPAKATATATTGYNSQPMKLTASAFNSGTATAVAQNFQWQAEAGGNDTPTPSGTLNLLFGSGTSTPTETGLKISSNGVFTFVAGQAYPGAGTVTSVGSGTGLTGGPITSSGSLSIATGGVSNAMLANPSLTVTAGTALKGGGSVALGGSTTLNVDTTKIPQLGASNFFSAPLSVAESSGSIALTGDQTATSGTTYGVEGVSASFTSGSAGVIGETTAPAGGVAGVFGIAAGKSGTNYGVYGQNASPGGMGVFGWNLGTSGSSYGVLGQTSSPSGFGVYSYGNLGVNNGGLTVFGTTDGNGTSLIPNQVFFQDNGEIASGDANHRIIFDRVNNILELREYGNLLFSPGAISAQRTMRVAMTSAGDLQVDYAGLNAGSSTPGIRFGSGNTGEGISSDRTGSVNLQGIDFYTGFAPRMSITNAGHVGIGTTAPTSQLNVVGASAASGSSQSGISGIEGTGGNGDPFNPSFGGDAVLGFGGTGASGDGIGGFFGGGDSPGGSGDGVLADPGSGYAGNFRGNLNVSGTITAGVKDFRIDHPLDPANKYLIHASVESSEMMNIYTGNVTTDAQGEASVQLPEWFEVLNTDFRYQLTVIGVFAQAIVAREIQNHQFQIRTSLPNVKVSWQVAGVRQDAYARAHPLVVEEEKNPRLRGYYIHPELYGAAEERQIEWARHPQTMKLMKERREARRESTAAAETRPHPIAPAGNTMQRPEWVAGPAAPRMTVPQPPVSKIKSVEPLPRRSTQ